MSETTGIKNFDLLKRRFWSHRALAAMSIMRQSKETGLLPKSEGWSNVIEHELVEAEAVDVLGEKLGLSDEERQNLRTAALLHDVFKRREIEKARKEGPQSFDESAVEQVEWIRSLGYPEEIIELIESVAHTSFEKFDKDFNTISTARKIIHYVDDITLGNNIVSLNERIASLEANHEYRKLNERGKEVFNGKTYFEVQREISKKIEAEFAPRLGVSDPAAIPEYIKNCINDRIAQGE